MTAASESAAGIPLSAVYGPRGDSILRNLAGEWFLVPIRTTPADFRAIFTVNEVGAAIWGELDGSRPLGAVLEDVLDRFEAPRAEVEGDLLSFIGQLESAGLVERRGQ